jgi:hypothetical protein
MAGKIKWKLKLFTDSLGLSRAKLLINNRSFETPIRSLNHSDAEKYYSGYKILQSNANSLPFEELVRDFDQKDFKSIEDLMNKNIDINDVQIIKSDKQLINKINKRSPTIITPRINENIMLNNKTVKFLLDYQLEISNNSVITLPDPGTKWFDVRWKKLVDYSFEIINDRIDSFDVDNFMPIIYLSQPYEFIEKKIDYLMKKDIRSIGFKSGSYQSKLKKAVDFIEEMKGESPMWIHLTNVTQRMKNVSHSHLTALGKVHTISLYKFHPKVAQILSIKNKERPKTDALFHVVPEPTNEQIMRRKNKRKPKPPNGDLLEQSTLGYMTDSQHLNNFDTSVECKCKLHESFPSIDDFKYILESANRKEVLSVHDSYASTNEFIKLKKSIIDDESISYFRSKEFVMKEKKEIKKRFRIEL